MHNVEIKEKALQLRVEGMSISSISQHVNIGKSTVSYWCKNIVLSREAIQKIGDLSKSKRTKKLLLCSERQRVERIERVKKSNKEGSSLVGCLSNRDLLLLGLGLYWGEGYKGSTGELGFTNMDPNMIRTYIKWLALFDVQRDDLIFHLKINICYESRVDLMVEFWCTYLDVNKSQFTKSGLIKTKNKKIYKNQEDSYNGVLRVKVKRGLDLKNTMLGAIQHISNEVKRL